MDAQIVTIVSQMVVVVAITDYAFQCMRSLNAKLTATVACAISAELRCTCSMEAGLDMMMRNLWSILKMVECDLCTTKIAGTHKKLNLCFNCFLLKIERPEGSLMISEKKRLSEY